MENLSVIFLMTVIIYSFLIALAIAKRGSDSASRIFYLGSFLWFLLALLLAKFYPIKSTTTVNFIPFAKLALDGDYLLQTFLTFLLFIPLGFLLSIYGKQHGERLVLLKIAMFSLIIGIASEILQLLPLGNTFAVDHMIANTAGAMVGYLFFLLYNFLKKITRSKQ